MRFGRVARVFACCAASALVLGTWGVTAASADSGRRHDDGDGRSSHRHDHGNDHGSDHGRQGAIFVSAAGSGSGWGGSCDHPDFTMIQDGVNAASSGGTVIVCPGTYAEDVLVNKPLNLFGFNATVDATGLENGIQVVASYVTVAGFTVENANGEGVLVGVDGPTDAGLLPATGPVLTNVTIEHSDISNNNKGFNGTETGNCKYPGDCGGGLHFSVTTHSVARDDTVNGNSDGILLTDDYGPSSYNLVEGNTVDNNLSECGIVLPSHSGNAVTFDPTTFQVTAVNPTMGGVYGNVVRDNVADGNGTNPAPPQFGGLGSGSGIGLFASRPGSAVYNNIVVDNEASGNGLAGIAMHAHVPGGSDMDGNVLVHNKLGTNNTGGDGFDGPPGPSDLETTGIAVYSAVPVHMTISHNKIFDNTFGIWLSKTVTADGLDHNHFSNVTTPVVVG